MVLSIVGERMSAPDRMAARRAATAALAVLAAGALGAGVIGVAQAAGSLPENGFEGIGAFVLVLGLGGVAWFPASAAALRAIAGRLLLKVPGWPLALALVATGGAAAVGAGQVLAGTVPDVAVGLCGALASWVVVATGLAVVPGGNDGEGVDR